MRFKKVARFLFANSNHHVLYQVIVVGMVFYADRWWASYGVWRVVTSFTVPDHGTCGIIEAQ